MSNKARDDALSKMKPAPFRYKCEIHYFETNDDHRAKEHLELYHRKPSDLV